MRKLMTAMMVLAAAAWLAGCNGEKPADKDSGDKGDGAEMQKVVYICPMQCTDFETADASAKCPKCGMAVKAKSEVVGHGGDAHEGHNHMDGGGDAGDASVDGGGGDGDAGDASVNGGDDSGEPDAATDTSGGDGAGNGAGGETDDGGETDEGGDDAGEGGDADGMTM